MKAGAWSAVGLALAALAIGWAAFPAPAQDGAADADADEPSAYFIERFQKAQRLMGKGKREADDEAERIFRALVFERPKQAEPHHALGLLLMHRGRRKESLASLLEAAQHAPAEPTIQRDAGAALLYQARPEEAEPYFSRARREAPDDLETWVGWARCLLLSGERKRAQEAFRAAGRLDEGSIDARVGLAWTLVEDDPAEARKLIGPPVPAHFSDVALVDGLALERLGQVDQAAERLATAIEFAPPDGMGAAVLAAAAEALSRHRRVDATRAAAAKWLDVTLRWGSADRFRAGFLLAEAHNAGEDDDKAHGALRAVAEAVEAPPVLRARAELLRADRFAAAGDAGGARARLEAAAAFAEASFESSAARAILDGDAGGLQRAGVAADRGNDVAWLQALAARLSGDTSAAAQHERRAAELSRPRGEFPGFAVPRPKRAAAKDE